MLIVFIVDIALLSATRSHRFLVFKLKKMNIGTIGGKVMIILSVI